jgi:hypothetical protein
MKKGRLKPAAFSTTLARSIGLVGSAWLVPLTGLVRGPLRTVSTSETCRIGSHPPPANPTRSLPRSFGTLEECRRCPLFTYGLRWGPRMDGFKRAAAGGVNCEQCGHRMILKFTTLRLTESGKVRVYECVDCDRLTFISEPPVAAQGASSDASPKPTSS